MNNAREYLETKTDESWKKAIEGIAKVVTLTENGRNRLEGWAHHMKERWGPGGCPMYMVTGTTCPTNPVSSALVQMGSPRFLYTIYLGGDSFIPVSMLAWSDFPFLGDQHDYIANEETASWVDLLHGAETEGVIFLLHKHACENGDLHKQACKYQAPSTPTPTHH